MRTLIFIFPPCNAHCRRARKLRKMERKWEENLWNRAALASTVHTLRAFPSVLSLPALQEPTGNPWMWAIRVALGSQSTSIPSQATSSARDRPGRRFWVAFRREARIRSIAAQFSWLSLPPWSFQATRSSGETLKKLTKEVAKQPRLLLPHIHTYAPLLALPACGILRAGAVLPILRRCSPKLWEAKGRPGAPPRS